MSRRERDDLCSQYEKQLRGPIWRQQLAINLTGDYFRGIPKSERTPELSAFEELLSEETHDPLHKYTLEDLEIMRGEFETPELQNQFWFTFQHILIVRTYRLGLYYPLAQKLAAQYGFELPSDTDAFS